MRRLIHVVQAPRRRAGTNDERPTPNTPLDGGVLGVGLARSSAPGDSLGARGAQASVTVTLFIRTGVTGRSPGSVFVFSILCTTSMPSITFPKTGCFEFPGVNQSR